MRGGRGLAPPGSGEEGVAGTGWWGGDNRWQLVEGRHNCKDLEIQSRSPSPPHTAPGSSNTNPEAQKHHPLGTDLFLVVSGQRPTVCWQMFNKQLSEEKKALGATATDFCAINTPAMTDRKLPSGLP